MQSSAKRIYGFRQNCGYSDFGVGISDKKVQRNDNKTQRNDNKTQRNNDNTFDNNESNRTNREVAFKGLAELDDGVVGFWANITILKPIFDTIRDYNTDIILEFSDTLRDFFNNKVTSFKNDGFEVVSSVSNSVNGVVIKVSGSYLLEFATCLAGSPNSAVAKIGLEYRSINSNRNGINLKVKKWGKDDCYLNGVNVPNQTVTITLNRFACEDLVDNINTKHHFRQVLDDLIAVLRFDDDIDSVPELNDDLAASDNRLLVRQGSLSN